MPENARGVIRRVEMAHFSRKSRKWIALIIWIFGLALAGALGVWNYQANSADADNRLIGDASRSSGELASLLTYDKIKPNKDKAHALIDGAFEDERVYAVKITADGKLLDGQRRNYLWEPIPWDDEIAEYSIQGINPVKIYGRPVGAVEVWLSTRFAKEEKAIFLEREYWRFLIFAVFWTSVLLLLFWHWGIFRRWREKFFQRQTEPTPENSDTIILGICGYEPRQASASSQTEAATPEPVSAAEGRKHQRIDPDAWFVTAGMFRQTFAKAPDLMSRLYADGEIAGLCHLGRMLEQAAPCVGAARLRKSANGMQRVLNDPESEDNALAVDECVAALEEVLEALCGARAATAADGARS